MYELAISLVTGIWQNKGKYTPISVGSEDVLAAIESSNKFSILALAVRRQIVYTLAKQDLGRDVDGETREQLGQVNHRTISWNGLVEMLDMVLQHREVIQLRSYEDWPQNVSGMSPVVSIGAEYALPK